MNVNEQPVFEVRLRSKRAQRELGALQGVDYERVMARLKALAGYHRPQGCERLYDAICRARVGDFRIIYLIDENNRRIEVGGIHRRGETTYRGIEDLFR